MHDCEYCDESFAAEDAYLRHLRDEHAASLGRIESRRVATLDDDETTDAPETSKLALAGAVVVFGLIVAGLFAQLGDSGQQSGSLTDDAVAKPSGVGPQYDAGTLSVTVGGDAIDFSGDRYQHRSQAFHFQAGDGRRWHAHGDGVTLEFALETLGFGVAEGGFAAQNETYVRSDGDRVRYAVNGESVDPEQYVLQPGDRVEVVVRED
ncbi:MoaD/ThiS family protein [Haloarchaeobius sp. DFWS5]|uniref:MoaD/ThiS family protein n=1 Tax=Haloarchaeobius sp. DFWS5 TaxID=3446114 RepID=UPI003EB698C5